MLAKKIYPNDTVDWKVWHFYGDLPLDVLGPEGQRHLESAWKVVE